MVEATVHEARLEEARVLVELGELTQAEAEVAAILEESADDLDALRLFSKIKHMRGQLSLALACYAQLQARGTAPGESARDIEPKVDAAFHRNLTMIVVPRGNQSQLEQSALVPRAITREIVRFVSDFDEAVRLAFGEPLFN